MKILSLFFSLFFLQACTTGHCRQLRESEAMKNPKAPQPMAAEIENKSPLKSSLADRVKIFKPDGSRQCESTPGLSLNEMQKELKSIQVHQSWKRHDGMMRPQVCGAPTGQSNVYEIDRKDLEAAVRAGFQEWTLE